MVAVFVLSSFWLVAAFVYELVTLMLSLLGHDLPRRLRVAIASAVVVTPIALLAGQWLRHQELSHQEVLGHSEVANVSLVATGMVAMLVAMAGAKSLVHKGYRRAVRLFCGVHLGVYVLIPVAALLTYPTAWYALLVSFFAMNLLPLVLLGRVVELWRVSELGDPEHGGSLRSFAARYGISEREQEIVRVLLAGGTNSEIGEALSISPHTVKNHVYNVYRKAGVRNRIQLANLIRGLSSTNATESDPDA